MCLLSISAQRHKNSFIFFFFRKSKTDVLSSRVYVHTCFDALQRVLDYCLYWQTSRGIRESSWVPRSFFIFVSIVYTNNCLGFLSTEEFPFTPRTPTNKAAWFVRFILIENNSFKRRPKKKNENKGFFLSLRFTLYCTSCLNRWFGVRNGCRFKGEWINSKKKKISQFMEIVNFNNGFKFLTQLTLNFYVWLSLIFQFEDNAIFVLVW